MKAFVAIVAILCLWLKLASGVVPSFLNLTLLCDARPASEQVRAYRFYEKTAGTNWIFLGDSPTNSFIVSNVLVTVVHTYGVTASNTLGESAISAPYVAPNDPKPPTGLGIIQTSLLITNGATAIQFSTDLVNWNERFNFAPQFGNKLLVTMRQYPKEARMFMREQPLVAVAGPIPGGAR